jgi:hypothetical protein
MNFMDPTSPYTKLELSKTPFLLQVCGRTGSGKTSLIRYIAHNLTTEQGYNSILVFSSSGLDNDNYDYLPQKYVHTSYNEKILKRYALLHKNNRELRGLVIFDDIFGQLNYDSRFLQLLFRLHRQWGISLLFACHHFKEIPRAIRGLMHHFISFEYKSKLTLQEMHAEFAGDQDKELFVAAFKLPKYTFVLLNLREPDNKSYIIDKVDIPKTFKLKY